MDIRLKPRFPRRKQAVEVASLAIVLLLASGAGCGGSKEKASTEGGEKQPQGDAAVFQPKGDEGSIAGKISFEGQAPKFRPLSMDADSVCAAKHSSPVLPEAVVVNENGTLRNVFVYIKSGLEGKNFAV